MQTVSTAPSFITDIIASQMMSRVCCSHRFSNVSKLILSILYCATQVDARSTALPVRGAAVRGGAGTTVCRQRLDTAR